MNSNMLSQDEIDALLNGGGLSNDPVETTENNIHDLFSEMEQDAIGEIGNISFGSSATALSTLLNQKVQITTPTVSLVNKKELKDEFPHPSVSIQVHYTEGFTGSNILVIKQSDASIIADLMIGGDGSNPTDLGEIQLSAVQEAMNQMMGSAATSMSTVFQKKVDISPPAIELLDVQKGEGTNTIPDEELFLKVSFRLTVGHLIDSQIMQLLPIDFARELIKELMNSSNEESASAQDTIQVEEPPQLSKKENRVEMIEPSTQAQHQRKEQVQMNAKPVEFATFNTPPKSTEVQNLDMLLDIPLTVTVELGRTKRSIQNILELSTGSIIELDKLAGEPVDILINNKKVAKGEVVVIDENFGVRVTDILSQTERLNKIHKSY
ncbi:flagellar motor switch phosphatase FliY [Bacillus sp. FJAT-47783]|uniref:flagellar motor switch phosphatase FliY n=1 Tax=Bacillus sp. FJAT-47783 TaxID=2922712 RepID=UPI001FAD63F1|nr:flagellar motor switch phosphatase FliY [Bacillus sp. FJAT-47783]